MVAPFAGAWIEIVLCYVKEVRNGVAPFAGAWIEIQIRIKPMARPWSRSLRGSVD